MPSLERRRQQLRALYGFDFPDDLFRFWEFVRGARPLEPLHALDAMNIRLVGPFEVLAGRFDGRSPRFSLLLHWRYYADPPEFFTVFAGTKDGLHWGYFLDDPSEGEGCIAAYYARGAYELSPEGDDLFEVARLHLEMTCRDCEDSCRAEPEQAGDKRDRLTAMERLRAQLIRYATAERTETGRAYEEAYPPRAGRSARVVAATREGMGVVAPGDTFRPLTVSDRRLWKYLRREADPVEPVAEARHALDEGYPATALKLGKDLWGYRGERHRQYAYALLEAAYAALRRPVLGKVLGVHRENRALPSLDILENE